SQSQQASPLPEARELAAENLVAVVLPSSNVVLCSAAVLARCSTSLRSEESKLSSEAVHLDFTPAAEFPDDVVVDFLSRLHRAITNREDAFLLADWVPAWCILAAALGIQELAS